MFGQRARHEKLQFAHRVPPPLIRHLRAEVRTGRLSLAAAALELGLSLSRCYQLRTDYRRAGAHGQADTWSPGLSDGDPHSAWSPAAVALATKLFSSKPPSGYSAVASELHRRLDFRPDRASVRRWARDQQLAPDTRFKATPKPVKRWQARDYGARWQYDASPHAWLPGTADKQALLDILDDATRRNTGARLYDRETLPAHLDFLSRVCQAHGLPWIPYVDYHAFFYTQNPDALTQLGHARRCYGVRSPPGPNAPGQRQNRTPARLLAETPGPPVGHRPIRELTGANQLLDQLVPHANQHELPRELHQTPQQAHPQASTEKRTIIRPAPPVPGGLMSGANTRAFASPPTAPSPAVRSAKPLPPPRSAVIRCLRPNGDIYYLRHAPDPTAKPLVLLHCPVF